MIKVVYNADFGGFGLSEEAIKELAFLKQVAPDDLNTRWSWEDDYIPRHDPDLVTVVERLGKKANTRTSYLQIAEIRGPRYMIDEYDGNESVLEPHDLKWVVV